MSQQGVKQAAVRAATGNAGTWNEDWHALFDDAGIAAGTYNERMLAYIQTKDLPQVTVWDFEAETLTGFTNGRLFERESYDSNGQRVMLPIGTWPLEYDERGRIVGRKVLGQHWDSTGKYGPHDDVRFDSVSWFKPAGKIRLEVTPLETGAFRRWLYLSDGSPSNEIAILAHEGKVIARVNTSGKQVVRLSGGSVAANRRLRVDLHFSDNSWHFMVNNTFAGFSNEGKVPTITEAHLGGGLGIAGGTIMHRMEFL